MRSQEDMPNYGRTENGRSIMKIDQLSHSEKILLVESLWDSIRSEAEMSPLTEAQRLELDRRLAEYEVSPGQGDSWASVKERILNL